MRGVRGNGEEANVTTTTNARTWLDDVAPELVDILANPEDGTPRLIYADMERQPHD